MEAFGACRCGARVAEGGEESHRERFAFFGEDALGEARCVAIERCEACARFTAGQCLARFIE